MEIPVIRKSKLYVYKVREDCPAGWLPVHSLRAAALFATAQSCGYSPQESDDLAEVYVLKQIFPGMKYEQSLEKKLQALLS